MRWNRWMVGRRRVAVASAATLAILGPLAWLWQASLLPDTYSMMAMGYLDYGGGVNLGEPGHDGQGPHPGHERSVTSLIADPDRAPDVRVRLVARKHRFPLPSGRMVEGYTLNGQSPGPVIHATADQLVEVRLVNESVPDGVTLHWHGVDVPNAADGVAGVTQDAVGVGNEYVYRFVAHQIGTFWYHSHQVSHEQVRGGLLGALVVTPREPAANTVDVVALSHLYGATRTINGREGDVDVDVPPGWMARVRVINTENAAMPAWVSGAPFRLVAIDGTDVRGPTSVADKAVLIAAGGRADIEVTMPVSGSPVRVHVGGPEAIVLGLTSHGSTPVARPAAIVDPLSYGTAAPISFDPDKPTRQFQYDIGRRPAFIDGRPGLVWTVNGHVYPDVPMFVVTDGDVVRMHITNHSGETHPMHLHGHHAVVLARNGVRATGSPWWVDSLTVANGDSYDVAFLADNPGIWMDHCHNLPHVAEGLVAHLMYWNVTTPFTIGGAAGNTPE